MRISSVTASAAAKQICSAVNLKTPVSSSTAAKVLSSASSRATNPQSATPPILSSTPSPSSAPCARRSAPNRGILNQIPNLGRTFSSTPSKCANVIPSSSLIDVTTLPNKVRVATEATPGHFSAVGVYIDTGSRLERAWVPGESGVCHLLDRMAFKSTKNRSTEEMTRAMEALGGQMMASASRETIMYQCSVFNQDVESALSILADTILNPNLLAEELDAQREATAYEVSEIWNKPEMIIPEILHTVAYSGKTLGNPLLCPIESLEVMTVDNVRNFMNTWYTPDRIVVAGAGMPHEQLVELSQKYFGQISPPGLIAEESLGSPTRSSTPSSSSSRGSSPQSSIFSSSSSSLSSYLTGSADFSTAAKQSAQHALTPLSPASIAELASTRAAYTGGEAYLPRPDLEFTHIYVAFEGLSIHDEDIYAVATLQILLGGGGSFSAGGPGKGMYSRLYSNVLNQHHSVDFCAAFHHCYNDTGLFGISASVHPSFNSAIPHVIARELELCTSGEYQGSVTQAELNRAKNQLKSSLVMALESRLVEVEDLGRQVQVHGKKTSVEEMCEKVDKVDLPTLHRVASRILRPQRTSVTLNHGLGNGTSTVVAQGKLEGLGDLRTFLASRGLGAPPS
ncbi:hypothetical protein IE53DRAFT_385963 [Violaceomyces palustris]|uniref:Uncharacterized protein n=1 Tax=Violaceomyces palustris TaxID=1673888 RepID=A0ACD0P0R5_9BASI|nr:hypothetical protein IE53DRAFT_385963 [Violaceomyces palustris]